MSMFTRSDKPADQPSTTTTSARETQAPRPQATAQPISAAAVPMPAPGVSVISKALKITGQLESTEDIRIDGQVEGDVRGLSVTVGAGAKVKGTVYGDAVEVSGTVDGRIEAKKVVLTGTAHMSGDVLHQDIKIDSGAFVDGHLKPEFAKSNASHMNYTAAKVATSVTKAAPEPEQPNGAAKP